MFMRIIRHPAGMVVLAMVSLFAIYEISVRFIAYTSDAYINSDVVVISAQIDGPISRLAVQNNQVVAAGQKLFEIDPTPYALKVKEREAALMQARADLGLANDEVTAAKANITSAQAVEANASATLDRVKSLTKDGFATDAELDVATRDMATSSANILVSQSALSIANRRVSVSSATIVSAQADLAKAQYELSKTEVTTPDAGQVAPFTIRQGDYVRPGTEVLAVVTGERRRVVANVAERHLARIKPGQQVWLTLGSDPWTIHSGRVSGISAGVARSADAPSVVPYVEPTTDWVRLPRRFPVEVTLDQWPANLGLFVGADARVLVWF